MSSFSIEDGCFYDIDFQTAFSKIENGDTFIFLVGHEGCLWCAELIPIVDEICREKSINIYYLDSLSEDNEQQYDQYYDRLAELCSDYTTPDEGTPAIWAPSIIYVYQGKVIDVHEGTVNTHNAYERTMTDREKERLRYNLRKEFDRMLTGGQ